MIFWSSCILALVEGIEGLEHDVIARTRRLPARR